MERSEIRGGIDASWQSRITLRSIRARYLKDRAKIASLRIFAVVIDFRLRSHRVSTPLRSNVSRQQSRCFNDLQCITPAASATAFDNRHRIVLKAKILLTKGRLPEASREVERVRFPRADLQSAPGRLRASCPPVLRPVRGVLPLGWDRKARVTPVRTASQETWPGAEPRGQSLGKRRGGAPKASALRSARCRAPQSTAMVGAPFRRSASLYFFGGEKFVALVCKTRARLRRGNESACFTSPRARGERRLLRAPFLT